MEGPATPGRLAQGNRQLHPRKRKRVSPQQQPRGTAYGIRPIQRRRRAHRAVATVTHGRGALDEELLAECRASDTKPARRLRDLVETGRISALPTGLSEASSAYRERSS